MRHGQVILPEAAQHPCSDWSARLPGAPPAGDGSLSVAPGARSHGRPLPAAEIEGVAHRLYFEEAGPGGGGIPAGLPAHRRRRQPAVPPSAGRSARSPRASACWPSTCPGTASRRRPTAGRSGEYRLTTAVLHGGHPRLLPRDGARPAGGHGLLDRRAHRAQSRDRPCRRVPRPDRARGRRLPAAVVRHRAGCTGPTSMAARSAPRWSPA